jgi:hypothetical protein
MWMCMPARPRLCEAFSTHAHAHKDTHTGGPTLGQLGDTFHSHAHSHTHTHTHTHTHAGSPTLGHGDTFHSGLAGRHGASIASALGGRHGASIASNATATAVHHLTGLTGSLLYMAPEVYKGLPYNQKVTTGARIWRELV